jgi:hypothetical protein
MDISLSDDDDDDDVCAVTVGDGIDGIDDGDDDDDDDGCDTIDVVVDGGGNMDDDVDDGERCSAMLDECAKCDVLLITKNDRTNFIVCNATTMTIEQRLTRFATTTDSTPFEKKCQNETFRSPFRTTRAANRGKRDKKTSSIRLRRRRPGPNATRADFEKKKFSQISERARMIRSKQTYHSQIVLNKSKHTAISQQQPRIRSLDSRYTPRVWQRVGVRRRAPRAPSTTSRTRAKFYRSILVVLVDRTRRINRSGTPSTRARSHAVRRRRVPPPPPLKRKSNRSRLSVPCLCVLQTLNTM